MEAEDPFIACSRGKSKHFAPFFDYYPCSVSSSLPVLAHSSLRIFLLLSSFNINFILYQPLELSANYRRVLTQEEKLIFNVDDDSDDEQY